MSSLGARTNANSAKPDYCESARQVTGVSQVTRFARLDPHRPIAPRIGRLPRIKYAGDSRSFRTDTEIGEYMRFDNWCQLMANRPAIFGRSAAPSPLPDLPRPLCVSLPRTRVSSSAHATPRRPGSSCVINLIERLAREQRAFRKSLPGPHVAAPA